MEGDEGEQSVLLRLFKFLSQTTLRSPLFTNEHSLFVITGYTPYLLLKASESSLMAIR